MTTALLIMAGICGAGTAVPITMFATYCGCKLIDTVTGRSGGDGFVTVSPLVGVILSPFGAIAGAVLSVHLVQHFIQ